MIFIMILMIHDKNIIDDIESDIHHEIDITGMNNDNYYDIHDKFDIYDNIHHGIDQ